MTDLFNQIKKALDLNLFYLALMSTMSIPDICSSLQSPDGQASKDKYIDWYNKYMKKEYINYINGEDCYYFRCSLLHQGLTLHPKSNYERLLFIEPDNHNNILHLNIINNSLNINVKIFCIDLINGAENWLNDYGNDENFKKNYNKFMRRYINGFPKLIVGVPVIT